MNALQATADPHDDLALAGFLRSPGCGLSDESLYYLANGRIGKQSLWETIQQGFQLPDGEAQQRRVWAVHLLTKLHKLAGRTQVADLLKLFLDETNYLAALRLAGQPRALRNVAKLLADVHNSELVNVADFLEYATNLKDSGSREGEARSTAGGAVQIMSIHQAKGLEFPVVILGDAAYGGSNRGSSILVDPELGVLLGKEGTEGEKPAVYELGKKLNGDQDSAEVDRLLYVALTRAEQILMVSGNCAIARNGTVSARGWLGQLAEITGLNQFSLETYDSEGEQSVFIGLDVGETAVSANFYEPKFKPIYSIVEEEPTVVQPELLESVHRSLNTPIIQPAVDSPEEETPERVWQVIPTAKRPQAPAWVIGSLVHEAIAIWRFPGPGFDTWVKARAGSFGLTDKEQLNHAVREVEKLLGRFQKWEDYRAIAEAERRFHELPYSYVTEFGNQVETGYIDLLYLQDGQWTIVDFKTDEIRDESVVHDLLVKKKYFYQIRRYGTAVERLVGERPRLLICLLNGKSGIITRIIPNNDLKN
jgi:ATP-dependent exoDNAse (exonuclease V) beta subunit